MDDAMAKRILLLQTQRFATLCFLLFRLEEEPFIDVLLSVVPEPCRSFQILVVLFAPFQNTDTRKTIKHPTIVFARQHFALLVTIEKRSETERPFSLSASPNRAHSPRH